MANWILGRNPFQEEIQLSTADEQETTVLPVHGICPNCGRRIYEKYYSGEKEDCVAGREVCSVCNKGCIKFIVHVHNTDEPATQDANGKCCCCGNDRLVEL